MKKGIVFDVVLVILLIVMFYMMGYNAGYSRGKEFGMIRGATIAIQEIDRTAGKSLDKLIERIEEERK